MVSNGINYMYACDSLSENLFKVKVGLQTHYAWLKVIISYYTVPLLFSFLG